MSTAVDVGAAVRAETKPRDALFWVLLLIALGTLLTGLIQMIAPRFVLGMVGADASGAAPYFFAIVGMFMALFGALMTHALLDVADHPVAVLWSAVQKLGASIAVAIGIMHAMFGALAYGVAGLDLLTGILLLVYWRRIRGASVTRA